MIKDVYLDWDTMEVILIFDNEQELRIPISIFVESDENIYFCRIR